MTPSDEARPATELGRRQLLQGSIAAAAATAVSGLALAAESSDEQTPLRGRIRQSIVFWCFNSAGEKWDIERHVPGRPAVGLRVGGNLRTEELADSPPLRAHLRNRS